MDVLTAGVADNLFFTNTDQSDQLDSLANQALSNGIDKYQDGDYEGAAEAFNRAFGLSVHGDYAYEAVHYASLSYQALGDNDKAIHEYEKAVKVNSTDDRLYLDMGNLLYSQGRYGDALDALENAVRLNDDSTNRYSLGQAYLKLERYSEAANQFEKIAKTGGDYSRNGYFGLGLTYRAEGKYDAAVDYFQRAYDKDHDFYDAYAEIGYTYIDAGDLDQAQSIQAELEYMDEDAADLLDSAINQSTKPKILFAYANSSFQYYSNPKTNVSALDDYLANAGASKTLTMQFQFNKAMDRESVENIINWSIARSTEGGPGMGYNLNTGIPSTEVSLLQFPISVFYDEDAQTATVRFDVNQNSDANGTIDPGHIVFAFNGVDADGNDMDADFDHYMGFCGSF
jgi:tetratricopeptide (TPR) repeat protein